MHVLSPASNKNLHLSDWAKLFDTVMSEEEEKEDGSSGESVAQGCSSTSSSPRAFVRHSDITVTSSTPKHDVTNTRGDVTNARCDVTNTRGDVTNARCDVTNTRGDVTNARCDVMNPRYDVPRAEASSLAIFSFVSAERNGLPGTSYREQQQRLREAVASSSLLRGPAGLLLDTREKGVMFPMVHFTDNKEALRMRLHQAGSLLDDAALGPEWVLQQGVYREVRNILPDRSPGYEGEDDESSYILIGFKSLDRNFSQVMVDTWKDWTGARSIYFHLPDELGLSRISFYHRETPEDLQLFMYIVMVEVRCTGTPEKVCRLLDFTQRLRVERMNGYISVYTPLQTSVLLNSVTSRVISPTVVKHGDTARKLLNHLTIFESRPRNSKSPVRPEI